MVPRGLSCQFSAGDPASQGEHRIMRTSLPRFAIVSTTMDHLPDKKILGAVRGEGPTVSLTTTEEDTGAKCGQIHSPPVSQALSDNVNLQRCSKVGFTVETHFFFSWKNHLLYCKISKLLVKGKIVNILWKYLYKKRENAWPRCLSGMGLPKQQAHIYASAQLLPTGHILRTRVSNRPKRKRLGRPRAWGKGGETCYSQLRSLPQRCLCVLPSHSSQAGQWAESWWHANSPTLE